MTPDHSSVAVDPLAKRKSLVTAIVLSISTITSVVFLSYALVQKAEAANLKEKLEQLTQQVQQIESVARKQAEDAGAEAMRQRAISQELNRQLLECKGNRTK